MMALQEAVRNLIEQFHTLTEISESNGTTLTVILKSSKLQKMWVANVGDSQAILISAHSSTTTSNFTFEVITEMHRTSNVSELNRVQNLGATFTSAEDPKYIIHPADLSKEFPRVIGLTRAVGDLEFHPLISAEPFFREIDLKDGHRYLIVATDGLWDVVEPSDILSSFVEILDKKKGFESEEWIQLLEDLLVNSYGTPDFADDVAVIIGKFDLVAEK